MMRHSYTIEDQSVSLFVGCRPIRVIGRGTYGVVFQVAFNDGHSTSLVAVKKCRIGESEGPSLLREISMLRHLQGHPNVVRAMSFDVWNHNLYIYQEYVSSDLSQLINSGAYIHTRAVIFQLLCGVRWIHSADIIHRDIKPNNILVHEDGQVKVCDFGLAHESSTIGVDSYVVSRWYRAPELLLGKPYGFAVDIWAVGCVWSEIILGRPLFAGNTTVHQLMCILHTLGTEDLEDQYEEPFDWVNTFARRPSELMQVLANSYSIVNDVLRFRATQRPTAHELLQHEYFTDIANHLNTNTQDCQEGSFVFPNISGAEDMENAIITQIRTLLD